MYLWLCAHSGSGQKHYTSTQRLSFSAEQTNWGRHRLSFSSTLLGLGFPLKHSHGTLDKHVHTHAVEHPEAWQCLNKGDVCPLLGGGGITHCAGLVATAAKGQVAGIHLSEARMLNTCGPARPVTHRGSETLPHSPTPASTYAVGEYSTLEVRISHGGLAQEALLLGLEDSLFYTHTRERGHPNS